MVGNIDGNKLCITITASLAFLLAIVLLAIGKFTGSDFVLFMTTLSIMTLVIWCLPKISEFSIAGNSVKLKETLNEAEKITKDLKVLRRFSMKQFLNNMNVRGGNNHVVLHRFFSFISTYNELIDSKDLVDEFRKELTEVTELLLISCFCFINNVGYDINIKTIEDVRHSRAVLEEAKSKYYSLSENERNINLGVVNAGCFAEVSILLDDALIELEKGRYAPVGYPDFEIKDFNMPVFSAR
ncbi:hypothetical protein [Klebsiella aerogenes]|uniref:hypothetical protein n=1 Tax=Klebsiella aerogenes TaxID=548 RepID=UPI0034D21951